MRIYSIDAKNQGTFFLFSKKGKGDLRPPPGRYAPDNH